MSSTRLPVPGVNKGQAPGVQERPGQAEALGQGRVGAVDAVADQGVAQGGQVDPDLVGAAGQQGGFDQLEAGKVSRARRG